MKTKEFIIILDFASEQVFITEYHSNSVASYEEFYEQLNKKYDLHLSDSNCQCMIVQETLNLKWI